MASSNSEAESVIVLAWDQDLYWEEKAKNGAK